MDDLLPNIPTLHVCEIELPREVERLYEIAYNLWWAWTPAARELFAAIDPVKWAHYRNPVELLINVDPHRWHPLLADDGFQTRYREVVLAFDDYLQRRGGTWFDPHRGPGADGPFAYFSMEFGLHQSLAIYSGGLGVLSGDHCKAASDLGAPLVAVGLLYRHGYFKQTIDAEGFQQHTYPEYDFTRLPLQPVATPTGREVKVSVSLPGRDVQVKLWLARVGRVPLVLLDTDLPENHPSDRPITGQLYVRGREMRLLQEIVLGRGGVEALRAIGIEPAAWHMNEGHSVFLQLERLRRAVREHGMAAEEALASLRPNTVFTTHTPVPAGNEQFETGLIEKYFAAWCDEVGMTMEQLLALGRAHDGDGLFNLTALAVRTASWHNGVSELNGRVASDMWRHLFPPGEEMPIVGLTNGVHARTWIGPEMQLLLRRHLGEWEAKLLDPEAWEGVRAVPDQEIWRAHLTQKARLGRFVRARLQEQAARHGSSPDELRAIEAVFDESVLTLGFARRFATYKRAGLVFQDLERLKKMLAADARPVQLIFAGKAHPADRPGQKVVQQIFDLSIDDAFRGKVILLENYDMRMGSMLVQGVDVWLNTPRRPLEASGTSGQKVAMNGGLNLSIADGWWPEGWNGANGWVIGGEGHYDDEAEQDRDDAASLYDLLENKVLPLYYDHQGGEFSAGWLAMMKEAMSTLSPRFSAARMVADYTRQAYLPAARR